MNRGILVFASKKVGFELSKYLFDIEAPINRVIVAKKTDVDIMELVKVHKVETSFYDDKLYARLAEKKDRYEWLLNLWSPHILSAAMLNLAAHRLNVHPSLVPHCRGNDNAAWIIRKGLPAGVSILEIGKGVDAGEVYAQREITYSFPIKGRQLHAILENELIALFKECWPAIYSKKMAPKPQQEDASSHTRSQTEKDRILQDASKALPVEEFMRWLLAHDFSPGTTAEISYGDRTYKLTLNVEEKESCGG